MGFNSYLLNLAFQEITAGISGTGTSMDLRFTITANSGNEKFAVDELTINGTSSSDPTIGFEAATSSQTETDATFNVSIPITVSNYGTDQIDVSVAVSGSAEVADYTLNTASLSFTSDGSQNISLDINDDADADEETVILTITETSAVSGLVISQSTHTVTITDDEIPSVPAAGTVFITEVLDGPITNFDYLELFNNSNETVSLSTSKLVRYTSAGSYDNFVFDFGADESGSDSDITIPPYGFLIVARSGIRADFNTAFGITLPAGVNYNNGSGNNYFGANRRWKLRTGGTANTDDGTLIDDTLIGVGADTSYKNIFTGVFTNDDLINATPGALEYLVYNGGAWVNTTAMDATTAAKDAYIYDDYTVSANAAANNIGINTGNTLTIGSSVGLDIDGNLTANGNMSINSGGSLIVSGTSSGNITYNRNLANTNWYLVSSPEMGQDIDTFVSAEGLASGTNNNNMGLASYDNTSAAWDYYQNGTSGSGDFALGSGRSIKLAAASDISFTGTMPVENVSIEITSNTNGYNLVGNPYPSYIAANTGADSSNNILTVNTSILSEATLWFWNQATNTYDAINQASSSMDISPAQGFFVETEGTNSLSITEAMQSHQSADTFQRLSSERPEISLVLSDGEITRDTDVYYIDGTTTGFDNGYDSTTFGGAANSFSIYTHLVANSNGQDLAIQSLPNSDLDTMIIPVGITAAAGEQISISANAINLPEGVNIYLEDKNDDSFTILDSTSVFTTTPDEDLNGIGRFYIHTTATALSDNQVSLTNVSMYVVDSNLTITGVHTANASVRVYDLVGKEVVNTSFEGTGLNKIELPVLTTGVYVVQLETQTEAVNKKIIIKK